MKNACSVGKSSIGKKEQHPKLQSSALYDVLGLPVTTCVIKRVLQNLSFILFSTPIESFDLTFYGCL